MIPPEQVEQSVHREQRELGSRVVAEALCLAFDGGPRQRDITEVVADPREGKDVGRVGNVCVGPVQLRHLFVARDPNRDIAFALRETGCDLGQSGCPGQHRAHEPDRYPGHHRLDHFHI